MKKTMIVSIVLIAIVVMAIVGYNVYRRPATFRHLTNKSLDGQQVNELKNTILGKDDKRILVAYFSYSGTTKNVATTLSEKVGADLFEIAPKEEYSNVYTQSNSEIRRGSKPELTDNVSDMDDYDIVFVGYPIWWHTAPMIIGTFLENYDLTGMDIYPFSQSASMDTEQFDNSMDFVRENAAGANVHDGLFVQATDTDGIRSYLTANGFGK